MTPTFQKFNAIIADPDLGSRMRLKQATASVVQFGEVGLAGNVNEVLGRLSTKSNIDVIFFSYRISQEEMTRCITEAKKTQCGSDLAFVLVLKSVDQQNSAVAQHMLIGIDGFLFEPYSVDQLVEITNLANRIKRERAEAREKVAITLLVSDLMTQLDLVAFLRSQNLEVTRSQQKLAEMANRIHELSESGRSHYFQIAIQRFSDAPPPRPMFQARSYSGASSRVKKMLGQKLVAEVEKLQEVERAKVSSTS